VKKVVDVVKIAAADLSAGAAGADMREMNRKLQLMLEETLTKNMHLSRVRGWTHLCHLQYMMHLRAGFGDSFE